MFAPQTAENKEGHGAKRGILRDLAIVNPSIALDFRPSRSTAFSEKLISAFVLSSVPDST